MKKNEIREYLLNNEDVLLDVVSELNSWNGCLDYLDFWENDEEFFNTFFENPMDALRECDVYLIRQPSLYLVISPYVSD